MGLRLVAEQTSMVGPMHLPSMLRLVFVDSATLHPDLKAIQLHRSPALYMARVHMISASMRLPLASEDASLS